MPRPRIAALEPPYEPETASLLAKWMTPGNDVEPLRLFRTLAVHQELASRMRPLGAGILGHPRLDPRDREILILRTCARALGGALSLSRTRSEGTTQPEVARLMRPRRECVVKDDGGGDDGITI